MNTYYEPIPNAAFDMIKRKSEVIFEKIKMMSVGDAVLIKKEDLSSFYNVCRAHGIKVARRKRGDDYLMGIKQNTYLDKIREKMAKMEAQKRAESGLHDDDGEEWGNG